jgi:hypothetical protein
VTAPTRVLSALLCDPDAAVQMAGPLLRGLGLVDRPVDPDFAVSLRDGFVETDVDVWFASLGGPR